MTAPLEATLSLSPEVLEAISQRAAVIVLERLEEQSRAADDRWLTTREAAALSGSRSRPCIS